LSLDTARRVLEIESLAVRQLIPRLNRSFEEAVSRLCGCRGRIVVTGMGKSGLICRKIAATFSSAGIPSHFMHPAEAMHGDLGMIVSGDVVLALSNSGETEEIVRLIELIRRLGAGIVSLTGNPESTLARHSDVHLDVGVDEEACSLDLLPTASTTAALAMGDALAVACYERRGFTDRDFARFHPGGRLGRKLMRVSDRMHRGDGIPSVPVGSSVRAAIEEMSAKRLGMTCVQEPGGTLAGIFTDGDLRRFLMSEPNPLAHDVSRAMTADPVTIRDTALATEALRIMESRKITSLPVIGGNGDLVGVIQIHDLWRTELF